MMEPTPRATPRSPVTVTEAVVPDYLPVIRSGDLFTRMTRDERDVYFDTLAGSSAEHVAPEAVFGTNGWVRMNAETGADPSVTKTLFDAEWDSMDPLQRRNLVYGNALSRFYLADVETAAGAVEMVSAGRLASALTAGKDGNVTLGMAAKGQGIAAPIIERTLFGYNPVSVEGGI